MNLNKMITLTLMTFLMVQTGDALGETVVMGALTCVRTTADVRSKCVPEDLYDCMINSSPRVITNSWINAPKSCIANPMDCEGGPLHDPIQLMGSFGDGQVKITFDDNFKLALKVGKNLVLSGISTFEETKANPAVNDLPGVKRSASLEAILDNKIYNMVCHTFTLDLDHLKKTKQSEVRSQLQAHFFKN